MTLLLLNFIMPSVYTMFFALPGQMQKVIGIVIHIMYHRSGGFEAQIFLFGREIFSWQVLGGGGREHMIEKEKIEEVKRLTDLAAFILSRGIEVKKNGKGYDGLCPFH
jgi:hypothetical protein